MLNYQRPVRWNLQHFTSFYILKILPKAQCCIGRFCTLGHATLSPVCRSCMTHATRRKNFINLLGERYYCGRHHGRIAPLNVVTRCITGLSLACKGICQSPEILNGYQLTIRAINKIKGLPLDTKTIAIYARGYRGQ